MSDARKVFVVHGRNIAIRDSMFAFLRSIDLEPLEWEKVQLAVVGMGTPSIFEIVDTGFSMAQAAVVLFTGDDEARLREEFHSQKEQEQETQLRPQLRANVLYEAGMAMGRYPDRTILVEIGQVKLFSDISGLHTIRLDNSPDKRKDLAQRLRKVGCAVDLDGSAWYKEGNFEPEEATTKRGSNRRRGK